MNDYNEIKIEIIDKFRDFNNLTNYGVKINKDDHDFKGKVDFLVHENRLTIRDFFPNGLDKNEESQALKILSDIEILSYQL